MTDHPHTIDRWDDATGQNLVEQIAAVGDYLVALAAGVRDRRSRAFMTTRVTDDLQPARDTRRARLNAGTR